MTIELTEKQAEYIREAHHRWNFAVGAVRSGKSHLAIQYTIPACVRERHGQKGLNMILGASKENIERNVLSPMRDIWGTRLVSGISSRNTAMLFGEKVYCIGAENVRQVTKLRGAEIKFCYCDEIVDINKEVFEMLKSRLSLPYSICHAAANPSYPTHFVKEFIDSASKGVDIYYQHYTIYDNPFLPAEYVRSLEAEYAGTVYKKRYIDGEWAKAEGLIFPMYESALGKAPLDSPSEYQLSIDYGTQNPFAAMLWEKHGKVWYATDLYYYSGRDTGRQKTDDDYYQDLERFLEGRGMDLDRHPITTIIDPSAASFITLLHRKPHFRVRTADNDVANGIRDTATVMKRGSIKIDPSLKMWIREAEGYVWDDKRPDSPVKESDHAMDATRYFVRTNRLARVETKYTPILR